MAHTRPIQPSDLYSPLTWERLIFIAKLLWDKRIWVARHAVRLDDNCGTGYRAWVQGKNAIIEAQPEHAQWLSILSRGAQFIFTIVTLPVRFCRGDDKKPVPENYSFAGLLEKANLELALGDTLEGIFRIAVETRKKSAFPKAVYFLHCREGGSIIRAWEIPRALPDTGTTPIVQPIEPVDLPPLIIQSVAQAQAEEDAAAAREREIEEAAKEIAKKSTRPKGA